MLIFLFILRSPFMLYLWTDIMRILVLDVILLFLLCIVAQIMYDSDIIFNFLIEKSLSILLWQRIRNIGRFLGCLILIIGINHFLWRNMFVLKIKTWINFYFWKKASLCLSIILGLKAFSYTRLKMLEHFCSDYYLHLDLRIWFGCSFIWTGS